MTAAPVIPQLPIVLRPVSGENVCGFLRRLAAANGHRSMDVFVRAIDLGYKFGPTSANPTWDRLAKVASLTEAEVQALCWNVPKEPGLVVAGVRTAYGFAYSRSTRVCLACLRESGIRRDFWSFAIVAACPRHATLLITHCTCGRPFLPGVKGRTWECVCGVTLDDLTELPAPAAAVNVARNLAARVGPLAGYLCDNDLRSPFDTLCAHDYMVVVHTLGLAATTPADKDNPLWGAKSYSERGLHPKPALDVVLARLQEATRIIDGWPDAYLMLLKEVEGRNTQVNASVIAGAFATSIGKLLGKPIRVADGLLLRRHENTEGYQTSYRGPNPYGGMSTGSPVAKRLQLRFHATGLALAVGAPAGSRLAGRVLRRVFECLSDEERAFCNEVLATLIRERATDLYWAALTSLSSETTKAIIEGGCRTSQLLGWEHPQLLPADPALYGLCRKGSHAYRSEAVAATLARLRAVAHRVEHTDGLSPLIPVGLRSCLRAWYKKTDLLLHVMNGQVVVYANVVSPKLSDLFVNLDDLRCICSPAKRGPSVA